MGIQLVNVQTAPRAEGGIANMWKNILLVYVLMLGGGLYIARESALNTKLLLVIGLTIGAVVGYYLAKMIADKFWPDLNKSK